MLNAILLSLFVGTAYPSQISNGGSQVYPESDSSRAFSSKPIHRDERSPTVKLNIYELSIPRVKIKSSKSIISLSNTTGLIDDQLLMVLRDSSMYLDNKH